ncbi:MAG: PolC-type DNA polymerase III [Erysipelotrichaceae bacterium]|nr:PolC-type DNA polymerase III [Erysipelotrichaceae bacterium]
MDVLEFLHRIGLSEEDCQYFVGGYVFQPIFYRQEETLIVPLKIQKALPFTLWLRLKNCIETKTCAKVLLKITSDHELFAPNDIRQFIEYFAKDYSSSFLHNLFPKIEEGKLFLTYRDEQEANKHQEDIEALSTFLTNCGISHEFSCSQEVDKRPVYLKSNDYHSSDKNHFHKVDRDACSYIPLTNANQELKNVYIEGEICEIEYRPIKQERELQMMIIHEGNEAFSVKRFEGKNCTKEQLHELQIGNYIRCYGDIKFDSFSQEMSMISNDIETIEAPEKRKDLCEEKRIELHAHTNKSEMDGVCECKDLVTQAFKWGHKAVTIMDHMVVQAYPAAQSTHLKLVKRDKDYDFKVIYGLEMNMVDSKADIVIQPDHTPLKDAIYVIFDLETTGLSNRYDSIIEFGAVKMHKGVEIERLQMFIKPPVKINAFTENLTGITQEMVNDAPTFEEAADHLLAFIDDHILVAHNAQFDLGFMNASLRRINRAPLTNPTIDTLPFAWALFPSKKKYALGNLVRIYNIGYDPEVAHRADYDAEVLSLAFNRMLQDLPDFDHMDTMDLQNFQQEDIYKKMFSNHISLLAKDMQGIKNIYELVTLSHTEYLTYSDRGEEKGTEKASNIIAEPRIIREEIAKRKEHLLIGSSCYNSELFEIACNKSQEELETCMQFYDYIEIQPLGNYKRLIEETGTFTKKRLEDVIRNIIDTAKRLNKIVVATGDSHYIDPEDKLIRDIYISAQRIGGARHPLYDRTHTQTAPDQHLRTTQEMLDEFAYLGEELAYELVVTNTHRIADQIEKMFPLYEDLHTPSIDGCEELLTQEIYKNAKEIYGDPLPEIVEKRIEKELGSVTKHGFSVQYYIAHLLVKRSRENGYVVGSRGSVGSSFIATMAKITEVNPLDPHYICPNCKHNEFFTKGEYASGFDLPDKNCPVCDTPMRADGHSIPFETFLGFAGDKVPDIDLNFSGEYQEKAQLQIKEIFGESHVFAAGTIGTVAKKTAYGYVKGYCETNQIPFFSKAKMEYLSAKCEGVKRTTGQHPGGIVVCPKINEIHDFTPVQYPANNPESEWKTTHFSIKDIHDNILKLDILGHVDPTAIKMLRDSSGIDPVKVPLHDEATMSLFSSTEALNILDKEKPYNESTGACGLPEFGTQFIRGILEMTRPTTFAELVSLSGLTHGTDVWLNNAKDLIEDGTCTLKEVIGCRDDIMVYLIQKGLPPKSAFDIMESVRKGRGLKPEWIELMKENNVPEWYIGSCLKIKYMFPKAHAVAYVMMAIRIAWFKVHEPQHYYAVYFSCRCDAYEIQTLIGGEEKIYARLTDIQNRINKGDQSISNKERDLVTTLEVAYEMTRRGYSFTNIDLNRSLASRFLVDPDNPKQIIPPFTSLDGLGANVGESVVQARQQQAFISKEDLQARTQLNQTQIKNLSDMGVLDHLQETNQLSLF